MHPENQTTSNPSKDIIQQTVGIYPLTPLNISFYHHYNIERVICKKDGLSYSALKDNPILKISVNDEIIEHNIANNFDNGLVESLENKTLPAVLLCAPPYNHIDNLLDEIRDIALNLIDKELLKGHSTLKRIYFPTFILISNGIIYDEVIYNLKTKLQKAEIPESIINNIADKIVRASVMQDAYKDNDTYFPDQKGSLKIALPKFPLFSQVVDILNSNEFKFSVNTNPHRVEFEKALVNIATNTIALIFALDKANYKLRKINIKEALSPANYAHKTLVDELQKAIFEIGKRAGAFPETEVFEKAWLPRKEQLIKDKGYQVSSSLQCFKTMIKNNTLPEKYFLSEYSLTYPLACYAKHYELFDEILLLEELDKMLVQTLEFAHKYSDKIIFTF